MEAQVLQLLAPKLGVNADKVVRKANELLNLAEIRSGSSSLAALNLNGSCKAVMCLELAARSLGQPVDRATAIMVCGSQKKLYNSALKAMECLLDLQSKATIPDLAIQFCCTNARDLAIEILKSYEEQQYGWDTADYSQALFNTAALYTACRKKKIQIEKPKLVDAAGVKKSTFDRLVAAMEKCAEKVLNAKSDVTFKKGKRTRSLVEEIEAKADHDTNDAKTAKKEDHDKTEESYEVWKTRILTDAYAALGQKYQPKS